MKNEMNEAMILKLSKAKNNKERIILLLKVDYGYQLTKKELSTVLGISTQTIDRRIKDNICIPEYIRSGNGDRATYHFPIVAVAEYLSNTIKLN